MKKLYVGNLPFQVGESELNELFGSAGFHPSNVVVIRDRYSNESRGFGFVEFENDEEADNAIQSLHGTDVQGRSLVVNQAREGGRGRPPRSGGGPGGGRGGRGGRRDGGGGGGRGGFRRGW